MAIVVLVFGCRTPMQPPITQPAAVLSEAEALRQLPEIETDIVLLLGAVNRLERTRRSFERFYIDTHNGRTFQKLCEGLPHYDETRTFHYAAYLADRKQLQTQLERRVELLAKQIRLLEQDVTSPDGLMLK